MLRAEYIAGLFDGEGSIGVYRNGRGTPHLRTQLTQNIYPASTAVLGELLARFGGNLSRIHDKTFNWQLNGHGANSFLKEIAPFLVLKRNQADLAIEWQSKKPLQLQRGTGGRILKTDVTQYDLDVEASLKAMKNTFTGHECIFDQDGGFSCRCGRGRGIHQE